MTLCRTCCGVLCSTYPWISLLCRISFLSTSAMSAAFRLNLKQLEVVCCSSRSLEFVLLTKFSCLLGSAASQQESEVCVAGGRHYVKICHVVYASLWYVLFVSNLLCCALQFENFVYVDSLSLSLSRFVFIHAMKFV